MVFQLRNILCPKKLLFGGIQGTQESSCAHPEFCWWVAMLRQLSSAISAPLNVKQVLCLLHNCEVTVVQYFFKWWSFPILHLTSEGSWPMTPLKQKWFVNLLPKCFVLALDNRCCWCKSFYCHQWLIDPLIIDLLNLFILNDRNKCCAAICTSKSPLRNFNLILQGN